MILTSGKCDAISKQREPFPHQISRIVSLLMIDKTKGDYRCLTSDCYRIFMDAGFECIAKITAPLGTSSASQSEMSQAKLSKKMLGRNRNIFVFRK